jgi:uncharacterized protein YktA (UPF0223 family)
MFKFLITVLAILYTSVALAIVPPEQIEKELASGNFTQARAHVEEVLNEKPNNARAHLMKAFLLAHVDKDVNAARTELDLVKSYDTKGNVVNSPLFKKVKDEVNITQFVPTPVQQQPFVPPEKESNVGSILLVFAILVGIIVMIFFFFKKPKYPEPHFQYQLDNDAYKRYKDYIDSNTNNNPVRNKVQQTSTYSSGQVVTQQPVVVTQPTQQRSAVADFALTAAATGTGVLAGELIHDMLKKEEKPKRRETSTEDTNYSSFSSTSSSYGSSYESPSSYSSSYSSSDSSSYSSSSSDSYSSSDSSSSSWD